MKKGFTLLEMLVASLLLSMLVAILSMVFSSSASAWRVGRAGVEGLHDVRLQAARFNLAADNALPYRAKGGGAGMNANHMLYVRSVWFNGGSLADASGRDAGGRGIVADTPNQVFGNGAANGVDNLRPYKEVQPSASVQGGTMDNYIIGAGSAGPDRRWNTKDDIATWPNQTGGTL